MKPAAFMPIFLILSVAIFFRFWLLDLFPISIIHDELNYVMNAKSLYYTNQNIPLTASALFSWGETNFDVVISEIPPYLILPWIGPNPLSHFNARLPYAVIGVLSVLLVYLIAKTLLNEKVAIFAGFMMAANPWSIHIGRTALEVNFASFFFLLGTYVLLIKDSWKILLAFPLFLGGFLSYLGAKLLFFPLILILLTYKFITSHNKVIKLPYIIFGILAFLTLFVYTMTINYQPAGTRTNELLIFEQNWASDIVNQERRQAIPNPASHIFINKLTVVLKRIAEVYLGAFSTTNLFARGETVAVYSIWEYGQFHYLDFPLIVLGLVVLFTTKRRVFWLMLSIIVLAPIVSAVDIVEKTYSIRAFPMIPYLVILAAVGFWYVIQRLKHLKLLVGVMVGLYLIGVFYFAHLYFFRYPVYAAERWFFSERIIANYLKLSKQDPSISKIYVVTQESPKNVLERYLFYSGAYESKESISKVNQNLESKNFSYDKAEFSHDCPQEVDFTKGEILIANAGRKCTSEEGNHGIVSLADAGTVFIIKGDLLCKNIQLSRYYRPMGLSDFHLEEMDKDKFCKSWIVSF